MLAIPVGNRPQHQDAGSLRHGFDDQNAWQNREIREVACKKRFVECDVFDPYYALGLEFNYPVYQQKWIAVRNRVHYARNINHLDRAAGWR